MRCPSVLCPANLRDTWPRFEIGYRHTLVPARSQPFDEMPDGDTGNRKSNRLNKATNPLPLINILDYILIYVKCGYSRYVSQSNIYVYL